MSERTAPRIRDALRWVEENCPFAERLSPSARVIARTVARAVLRCVGTADAPRLLDIGCGPMDKTAIFGRLGFSCSAVDDLGNPWHAAKGVRTRIAAFALCAGIDFHVRAAGREPLPFPAEHFDVVTLLDVIEHMHDSPWPLLDAAGLHLKPGGVLFISTPNSVNLRKRLSVLCGRTNYPPLEHFFRAASPWRGHVREYTLKEAAYACREAGFEVLRASTFEAFGHDKLRGRLGRAALGLVLALGCILPRLRSNILVVARRPHRWRARGPRPMGLPVPPEETAPGSKA